ncbi:MAG TPA: branched-chain amino acid ABC transporter permease [Candidatus Dormibacteraeota bacterium]|nr:branched-chain amino acid ABC transporter permease [Candidatus Dormibacteraeota bacterium]
MLSLLLQAAVDGILLGLIYTIMALGLSLILGVLGVINVAHSVFIMLGSFFALGLLTLLHLDPAVSFVLSVPVFFLAGAAVYRLLIQRVQRAPATIGILVLFGLMVVVETAGILLWTTDTRVITVGYSNLRLSAGPVTVNGARLVAGGLSLLATAAAYWFLKRTLTGRAVVAMADNRDAASVLGMDVDRLSMLIFGLGIAAAGAGGVAIGMTFPFAPQDHIQWLAWAFLIVIVGGLGRVESTLLGGLVIGLVQTLAGVLLPFSWVFLLMYLLLLVLLIVRGQGLAGARRREL